MLRNLCERLDEPHFNRYWKGLGTGHATTEGGHHDNEIYLSMRH